MNRQMMTWSRIPGWRETALLSTLRVSSTCVKPLETVLEHRFCGHGLRGLQLLLFVIPMSAKSLLCCLPGDPERVTSSSPRMAGPTSTFHLSPKAEIGNVQIAIGLDYKADALVPLEVLFHVVKAILTPDLDPADIPRCRWHTPSAVPPARAAIAISIQGGSYRLTQRDGK
jgi:hypothetical protein